MKAVADISITSRFLQPRGPGTPIVITATVSPALGSLRDGDSVQAALSPGALDTGSYASTAGAITAVSATVTINGAAAALADVVRFDDVVNVSITVSDAAGNTRDFNAGTQTVQGIAPTLAASDSLSGRTLTITVDSTTGVPAPVTALTALTLDGVEVRGDATGLTRGHMRYRTARMARRSHGQLRRRMSMAATRHPEARRLRPTCLHRRSHPRRRSPAIRHRVAQLQSLKASTPGRLYLL